MSDAVIKRLPRYHRYLGELLADGRLRISSAELSKIMNVTASQIRQDLNCFGGFGQQGYGYSVPYLYDNIAVTVYLEDSGTPDKLIEFDAFTPNGSETINATYHDATSDHVLYADTGESSLVWNSTCFENTEESQEVTLTYTLAKNIYLEALETL